MTNIPKICHLMWDKSPMSWLQVLTVVSFHDLNPDWEIVVYVPKQTVKELGVNTYVPDYMAKDYFPIIESLDYVTIKPVDLSEYFIRTDAHFILCSDQLRYLKIYEHGGVYCDFDVLWLRPMSEIVNMEVLGDVNDFDSTICYHEDTYGNTSIGVYISEKKSPFIAELISEQKKIKPPYSHQIFGTDIIDRMYPRLDLAKAKHPRLLGIKYKTWYPYDINNLKSLYIEDNIDPIKDKDVLCVHWFNGHRLSKAYINADTYDQPCSMTSILKETNYINKFR